MLLVDDDLLSRSTVSAVLAKIGYKKIDIDENGDVGLGKLISAETPYDVVICDLNMPEMDGVELMRHARETDFGGGIILLSGADKRLREIARELVTSQYLRFLGIISEPSTLRALEELLVGLQSAASEKRYVFS